MKQFILLLVISAFFQPVMAEKKTERLSVESPWFQVQESDLGFYESISGFDPVRGERVSELHIGQKALDMIQAADERIILSVFLFDNFYSDSEPVWDIVEELTSAIENKKRNQPDIKVTLIFGPLMRAYARRKAPAVVRMLNVGADVFYSDLLTTKAHTPIKIVESGHHTGRLLSNIPLVGIVPKLAKELAYAPIIPFKLDDQRASLQMAANAALVKANHRKILVTNSGGQWEALVSSANPHNASIPSTNYASSVKGPLAEYIYDVLRSDVVQSLKVARGFLGMNYGLGTKDYVVWNENADRNYKKNFLTETLPDIDRAQLNVGNPEALPRAKFVTENKIETEGVRILREVQPDDRVRIQMFYLSDYDMIRAVLHAATVTEHPVELLLDANKDAFNSIKDGTPNRQVGAFLMGNLNDKEIKKLQKYFPNYIQDGQLADLNLVVRWYKTTGEQNHAKIMSVTNEESGKYILFNGSANWTGKNLNDINLEANLIFEGSVQTTTKFNALFDKLFTNSDGLVYSLDYDGVYSEHAGMKKWLGGENKGFVGW